MTASTLRVERSTDDAAAGRRATRTLGAAVGLAIAAAVTAITVPLGPAPLFALGIPAATIVGAWLGPRIRDGERIGSTVAMMATATVVVAEALLLGGWLVGIALIPDMSGGTDPGSVIAGGVFIGLIGLVIVGGPMLVVTTPCAIAWAWIVRRLLRSH